MSPQTIETMPFTQIIAFKSYLDNLGKPLNSTLTVGTYFPFSQHPVVDRTGQSSMTLSGKMWADSLCNREMPFTQLPFSMPFFMVEVQ